jgi:2-methylfumaryl-CoA hydratase
MSMEFRSPRYGRLLEEFEVGAVFHHPWEVTVDTGMLALCAASFLDATPVFASAQYARALGFRDRPIHPLALLNFGLSFSVHDVSEQAIAHLAYIDVRFPEACYFGDTLRACSTVLGVKRSKEGERGVVHVRTVLSTEDERVVCRFERKVLVRAGGRLPDRASLPASTLPCAAETAARVPVEFGRPLNLPKSAPGFAGFFEDFAPGEAICHDVGRTVGESEHMQLTTMFRNTHPLHLEEPYAIAGFAKTRVVYGGLVFAWVVSLASRDTSGNVLWEAGFDNGAHPAGVVAGDTLYAASRVLRCETLTGCYGSVTFKLVGTKNVKPAALLDEGADLFADELAKESSNRLPDKVFEIERTVLMRKRS